MLNVRLRAYKRPHRGAVVGGFWVIFALAVLVGCGPNMQRQPRYQPYDASQFFPDGTSSRPLEADTVSRENLHTDTLRYTGKINGKLADTFPLPVTRDLLTRGHERYGIYCAPCHGPLGDGNGVIVQRGFSQPPSFHTDTLRNAPAGLFFDVITNGYGLMYPYAARVQPDDRWAIAAYIRALQLSQHATLHDVPPDQQPKLQEAQP
ncbi:MAG: cytochrome c [Herpetosiphonaceae bacterium]|nr:cytochrome c [Herpetosiphonaceae bacterium]